MIQASMRDGRLYPSTSSRRLSCMLRRVPKPMSCRTTHGAASQRRRFVLARQRIHRSPVIMRSRLMLEVASELVGDDAWQEKQVEIHFRPQGLPPWRIGFFASDAPNAVDAVMKGDADVAI